MRILLAMTLALLASACANRHEPVFDGGVYEPIYGAAGERTAESG